jgi:UPF0755 protein
LGAGILSLVGWNFWQDQVNAPYRGYLNPECRVTVPFGAGIQEIGSRLEREGIIKSSLLFVLYLRFQGYPSLMAGEYEFTTPLSIPQVVERLRRGDVVKRKFTIPEGLTLAEIAALWEEEGNGRIEDFLRVATSPALISDLDPDARDLEGYLFPDTYFLASDTDEQKIVGRMVGKFRQFWNPERQEAARTFQMTVREIVTLASLVEKETGTPSERPLVSAVFHNRLRLGIRLMCDPTVIYAVRLRKPYDGVINQSDLNLDSPYNTYVYPGLPPGPIANPGGQSIDAALNPAPADYLYFVSKNDGTHYFSRDYGSHQRAVERYQR